MGKTKKVEVILYKGPSRNFRLRNPQGHPDKWNWVTLKDGDVVPKEIIPQLKAEEKKTAIEKRIKEISEDLRDDGKRNFSHKKKSKKKSSSKPKKPKKKLKK